MSDRRVWLQEPWPTSSAPPSAPCTQIGVSNRPPTLIERILVAHGWRGRTSPPCKARRWELCRTPGGALAWMPQAARLWPERRELIEGQALWDELERRTAAIAAVIFCGDVEKRRHGRSGRVQPRRRRTREGQASERRPRQAADAGARGAARLRPRRHFAGHPIDPRQSLVDHSRRAHGDRAWARLRPIRAARRVRKGAAFRSCNGAKFGLVLVLGG